MSKTLIEVNNLHKKFTTSLKRSMFYGTTDILKSTFGIDSHPELLRKGEHWSLENINFKLESGQTIGLMGANGSGKSTLLRLINGIYPPDIGEIKINGQIGALIAVGAGFHPHMTGRENIYLNGAILGLSRNDINLKMKKIIDFADIGEYIDAPVATYSSGMNVRLGFSIAIHANIDILLADEILAVGDANFQKKCFEKILELKKQGVSTVLVSHAVSQLERLCDIGLFLNKGKQEYFGDIRETVKVYFDHLNDLTREKSANKSIASAVGVGNVTIINAKAYQANTSSESNEIEFKQDICIEFDYEFKSKEHNDYQLRINLRTFEGRDVQKLIFQESPFMDGKVYANEKMLKLNKSGHAKVTINNPTLFPQTFIVDIAVQSLRIDLHEGGLSNATQFSIIEPKNQKLYFEYGNMSITEYDYQISTI